jgi:CBS domain-containing protein
MKTVAEILKEKGDQSVHSIGPDASVYEAVALMAQKNIGALLVMEGERIVGMLSERDYARKVVLMSRSSKETRLREIMTPSVIYVHPAQSSEECMAVMTENRVRHLPVLDDHGRLVGLISIGDIEQLQHYITGEHA